MIEDLAALTLARCRWLERIQAALDTAEAVAAPLLLDPTTAIDAAALDLRLRQIRAEVMDLAQRIEAVTLAPEWMQLIGQKPLTRLVADHLRPQIRS